MAWTVVLAVSFGVGVAGSWAQEGGKDKPVEKAKEKALEYGKEKLDGMKPGTSGEPMDMQKMMEEMAKIAAPGPEHEKLKTKVGKWNVTSVWTMPDGKQEKSTGTAEIKPVLDGRFITEEIHMVNDENKMPFDGFGISGFDKQKGKYVGAWADNMCTALWTMEGTSDPSGRVFTSFMEGECPMTKEHVKHRMVTEISGDDKMVMKMWEQRGTAPESTNPVGEVTYTRIK
jgi:hypothetical protein